VSPMLLTLIPKALQNLLLPPILKCVLGVLIAYMLGWSLLAWGASFAVNEVIGTQGVESWAAHLAGSFFGMMIAWFFFPLLYPILISFFVDTIATSIEREDYPQLPPAKPPFWPSFWQDVRFSLKAILLNLLLLPLYLVPLVNVAVYYALNGYLLGTQFFRMAAGRRISFGEAKALEGKARGTIMLTGIAVSVAATVPLINIAAPILGIALMLHLFHQLRGTPEVVIIPPSY
jgi:CysZ protein